MGTTDPVADVKGKIANIGIAVIGYGYWGPNLVRNFSDLDAAQVLALDGFGGRARRAAA